MRVPTDKEIEEAKEYLRQRLDAELSMRTNLQIVMIEAAKQIIDISYRYKISPELFRFSANRQLQEEVDAIILSLLEIIEDYTYTLAVATHEDNKDAIITCITRESYGKTFTQRAREYADRFSKEVETAIAAGLLLNLSKDKLLSSIRQSENRHSSPFVQARYVHFQIPIASMHAESTSYLYRESEYR